MCNTQPAADDADKREEITSSFKQQDRNSATSQQQSQDDIRSKAESTIEHAGKLPTFNAKPGKAWEEELESWKTRFEDARRQQELVEWDHVELSQDGTSTFRTVRSTLPKGVYTNHWQSKSMSRKQEEEMHGDNAVMDDLDKYFKPTIKPGHFDASDDEDEDID